MHRIPPKGLGPVLLLLGLAACSEAPTTLEVPDESIQVQANVTASCDLLKDMAADARNHFLQPTRRTAQEMVRLLGDYCGAADQAATRTQAWAILELAESVVPASGDLLAGSRLVNALLACTSTLCQSSALPGISFTGPLGATGLFEIRRGGTTPAVSTSPTPFTDFQGNANTALWGVEVDQDWAAVTGANPVLVYGSNVLQGGLTLAELSIGNLQYRLGVFPDLGPFPDGALHVGVCFASSVDLPLVGGLEPEGRMRREGVLLEEHVPGFCAAPAQASLLGPFVALARRIAPASLRSLFFGDARVPVVGGTPLDFSRFAPVAANTNGRLEFVTEPNPVVIEGQPIGTIRVRARSGDGTPMERVLVSLYILNNLGIPAGAVLSGDIQSYTRESLVTGDEGIATFPFDDPELTFPGDGQPPTVGKPGAYRLCASAVFDSFTFTHACSGLFHARNAN